MNTSHPNSDGTAAAIEVAREFFALAKEEDSPKFTNMKLMKLLYRVQCLSLYDRGQPLFADTVKAWEDGPVVPAVFHLNKGVKVISYGHVLLGQPSAGLSSSDKELIHAVWTRYKHLTGDQLSDATHQEEAYLIARSRANKQHPSPIIRVEDMRSEVERDRAAQAALFDAYVAGTKAGM